MKKVIVVLMLGVFFFSAQGQEKSDKKLTRKERKELKRIENIEKMKIVDALVVSKHFVLEANTIKGKHGQFFSVNSSINFISVDQEKAVFQFGSAHMIGVNGVGGATVEGRINRYDVKKNEKTGSLNIVITISSSTGFYDINLDIYSEESANATVKTTSSNKRISYSGKIVSLSESRVYKGMSR